MDGHQTRINQPHHHPNTKQNDLHPNNLSYCKDFDKVCYRPTTGCSKVHLIEIFTKEDLNLVKIAANGVTKSDDNKSCNKIMTTTSSSSNNVNNRTSPSKKAKKKQKKKEDNSNIIVERVIYADHSKVSDGSVLRHRIADLPQIDTDVSDTDELHEHRNFLLHKQSNLSLPSVTCFESSSFDPDIELNQLRNRLISQKWFLSKWIRLKKKELDHTAKLVKTETKSELKNIKSNVTPINVLLSHASQRIDCGDGSTTSVASLRKGTCCFIDDSSIVCSQPSLPFTRHCKEHILYNVDQMLFTRCTAKTSSLTQCSRATFDIEKDEPLCDIHAQEPIPFDESKDTPKCTTRKRSKPLALLRPSRRKKRKGKGITHVNETIGGPASGGVDGVDTSDHDMVVPSNEVGVTPPPPPYTSNSRTIRNTSVVAESDLPAGLEIPNLPPSDEALVASLIDDPAVHDGSVDPLDADINEVLKKLQADAFPVDLFEPQAHQSSSSSSTLLHQSSNSLKESVHSESVMMDSHPEFAKDICPSLSNGSESTYTNNFIPSHMSHPLVNGHIAASSDIHPHINVSMSSPSHSLTANDDLCGLANNILGFLTPQQQQQLNGLIDGALASGTLASSPTTKLSSTPALDLMYQAVHSEHELPNSHAMVMPPTGSSTFFKSGNAYIPQMHSQDLNTHHNQLPSSLHLQPPSQSSIRMNPSGQIMTAPRLSNPHQFDQPNSFPPSVNSLPSGYTEGPSNSMSPSTTTTSGLPVLESSGSIVISGLNEASTRRAHFIRLTDLSENNQISGSLIGPKNVRKEDVSSV